MDKIISFCSQYAFGRNGFVILLFIYELLFSFPLKPRKKIKYFIPLIYAAYLLFGLKMPFIPISSGVVKVIFNCFLIFVVSILVQWLCSDKSLKRTVFDCSAAYISQNLTLNVQEIIATLFKCKGLSRLITYFVVFAIVGGIIYYFLVYKNKDNEIMVNVWQIIVVVVTAVAASNVIFSYFNVMHIDVNSRLLLKFVSIICCLLALLYQFSIFHNAELINKQRIFEQLLIAEERQRQVSQDTVELINIKCHDLKKQIAILKKSEGDKDVDEMLKEVEKAVAEYGSTIETGNANLDLVLAEKRVACDKNNVRLEVIADGSALDFMLAPDIYSLFVNALDNALESVVKSPEEKRTISLYVKKIGAMVSVRISNYCSEKAVFHGGIPETTKKDGRYHGYGVKSMHRVVEKYGGNMVFEVTEDTFTVNIVFSSVNGKTVQ